MPPLERFKRELVRDVVRDNLETIHGRPPRPLRRPPRARRTLLHGLGVALAPSLLFVGVSALSTGEADRAAPPRAVAASEPAPAEPFLPAPGRVNPAAFPLGVRKIVVDPGHGGSDPGARTPFGLWEKDITLDVAHRVRVLLLEASFDVVMTRVQDETMSLRERAQFANSERGDLFVSIHFNSILKRNHRGVETYYLGATDDRRVERLAGAENQASGYSLADFRRLLEGVYTHVRQKESREFAESVHKGLVTSLVSGNPAIKDSGVKPAPFLVLVATEMPGILAEVSYLSNEEDARLVADPAYRQSVAQAIFRGIRAYADARNRPGRKGSV